MPSLPHPLLPLQACILSTKGLPPPPPSQLRDLIKDFYNSRYASCLSALDTLMPSLLLDMHLGSHAAALYAQIRQRAIMQYVAPFTSVDLNVMARAFNSDVG